MHKIRVDFRQSDCKGSIDDYYVGRHYLYSGFITLCYNAFFLCSHLREYMSDRLLLLSSLASQTLLSDAERLPLELDAVELAATVLAVLQGLLNGVVSRLGLVVSIVDESRSGACRKIGRQFSACVADQSRKHSPGKTPGIQEVGSANCQMLTPGQRSFPRQAETLR